MANVTAEVFAEKKLDAGVAKARVPAGMKIMGGDEMPLDAESIRLVMRGWGLKKRIDELKELLDDINARLIEAHGTGCALVVPGVCRASLAEREAVKIRDAERLKAVLGERFSDLVREEVSYKPEPRLIEMACDGDEPLQPAIGACLTVGQSKSVTWRPER